MFIGEGSMVQCQHHTSIRMGFALRLLASAQLVGASVKTKLSTPVGWVGTIRDLHSPITIMIRKLYINVIFFLLKNKWVGLPLPTYVKNMNKFIFLLPFYVSLFSKHKKNKTNQKKRRSKS